MQSSQAINPDQKVIGYIVNTGLSEQLQVVVRQIQDKLLEAFPDAIWAAPPESLHITLMDWTAPLVDYGQDKDELFESIKPKYMKALAGALDHQKSIPIQFDVIEVHPGAIIIKGRDDGSYQKIREKFLDQIALLPGTKEPPRIVHSTICKFMKDIDIEDVKRVLLDESIDLREEVAEFRLVRESKIFLQEYEVVERFQLKG